jgi:calcineurin-like phosphoesterase
MEVGSLNDESRVAIQGVVVEIDGETRKALSIKRLSG